MKSYRRKQHGSKPGPMDRLVKAIGYDSYQEYLKSEHWAAFCEGQRDRECFCCGEKDKPLHCHHITYERLGHERPDDVVTVCGKCHYAIHKAVARGTLLCEAHVIRRGRLHRPKREQQAAGISIQWVNVDGLRNTHENESVEAVCDFLSDVGLMEEWRATQRAIDIGMARAVGDDDQWNLSRYIEMRRADRKVKRFRREGKPVPEHLLKWAIGAPFAHPTVTPDRKPQPTKKMTVEEPAFRLTKRGKRGTRPWELGAKEWEAINAQRR